MEFDDSWCEGLTEKEQEIIIRYVDLGCDEQLTANFFNHRTIIPIQRFLRSEKGHLALKRYLDLILAETKDTLEFKLISQYMLMAFYDPADVIDGEGMLTKDKLKDLGKLSRIVEGIEKTYAKGERPVYKIKLVDRQTAMEQLSKYSKIMADRLEITGKDGNPLFDVWKMSREERKARLKALQEKNKKKKKKNNEAD
jgi:hypothetical protein